MVCPQRLLVPGPEPSYRWGVTLVVLLAVAFAAGLYLGHRTGGRRALWRLHTGNYRDTVRKLGL